MGRVIEGYLYVYPYAGDCVFVHPERIDGRSFEELARVHRDVLEELEGRRARVTIEDKRVVVGALD